MESGHPLAIFLLHMDLSFAYVVADDNPSSNNLTITITVGLQPICAHPEKNPSYDTNDLYGPLIL